MEASKTFSADDNDEFVNTANCFFLSGEDTVVKALQQ